MKIDQIQNTMHKIQRTERAFTLVETLIYIGIVGAVVSAFVGFSLSVSDSRNKTYVAQEVQANARFAVDIISKKIKASNGINIASSTFNSDPGVLSLEMADITLNPTVFDLSVDDGILRITQGTSTPIMVVSDEVRVSNLVFTNLTASSSKENIKIEITVEFNDDSGDKELEYSQDLRTAVSVRR